MIVLQWAASGDLETFQMSFLQDKWVYHALNLSKWGPLISPNSLHKNQ